MKLSQRIAAVRQCVPAAFRRLCVETPLPTTVDPTKTPAAFRRLCVETFPARIKCGGSKPAAFRRLCVETTTETKR